MPVPEHLRDWLVPGASEIDESDLVGRVRCPCGSEEIELLYPGETVFRDGDRYPCDLKIGDHQFFVIRGRCASCGAEAPLFDKDFHGWNGLVPHDAEKAARSTIRLRACDTAERLTHPAGPLATGRLGPRLGRSQIGPRAP